MNTKPSKPISESTISDWTTHHIKTEHLNYYHGLSPIQDIQQSPTFKEKIDAIKPSLKKILNEEIINLTENQSVTHHQCRHPNNRSSLDELKSFCDDVHHHKILLNGSPITSICQIGIGGSISGPKAMHYAIKSWGHTEKLKSLFITNHDDEHIHQVLNRLTISETLFIIVSKSGTTIETKEIIDSISNQQPLENERFLKTQCITITTKNSPLDTHQYLKSFIFDASIGGRYSSTSFVGLVNLGLSFGTSAINQFLDGAHAADSSDLNLTNWESNIALNTAFLNVTYRTVNKWSSLAVVPYGSSFKHLPEFLTQLISESLGKSVDINGQPSNTENCPHILHGLGPDAQHTFFQQLHQSTTVTPCEFIYANPITKNQRHILQQICGQMVALAQGKESSDHRHHFSGNRPSTLLFLKGRSFQALGALIATYENRVLFEGLLLNINVFDQPGVELGKSITKSMTSSGNDLASQIYTSIQH